MACSIRLDVDPVIICPYDKNHKIARSRIHRHLVKCEKNFPVDYKKQCPYDATHRLFEDDMLEHIANCPMKLSASSINIGDSSSNILEIDSEIESKIECDEVWDEGIEAATSTNPFNEPTSQSLNVKQYSNIQYARGNALIAKRFNSKLRRPFGYSESMMLDISDQDSDDDSQSIKSDMGIGRGQIIAAKSQHIRGVSRFYSRGFRGRLTH